MLKRSQVYFRPQARHAIVSNLVAAVAAFPVVAYLCCESRTIGRAKTAENFALAAYQTFHFNDCMDSSSQKIDYVFSYFPYLGTQEEGTMVTTVAATEQPYPQYRITVRRDGDALPLVVIVSDSTQHERFDACNHPLQISPVSGRSLVGYRYYMQQKWLIGAFTGG